MSTLKSFDKDESRPPNSPATPTTMSNQISLQNKNHSCFSENIYQSHVCGNGKTD